MGDWSVRDVTDWSVYSLTMWSVCSVANWSVRRMADWSEYGFNLISFYHWWYHYQLSRFVDHHILFTHLILVVSIQKNHIFHTNITRTVSFFTCNCLFKNDRDVKLAYYDVYKVTSVQTYIQSLA